MLQCREVIGPGIARMWRASDNFWKYAKMDQDSHKLQASACS